MVDCWSNRHGKWYSLRLPFTSEIAVFQATHNQLNGPRGPHRPSVAILLAAVYLVVTPALAGDTTPILSEIITSLTKSTAAVGPITIEWTFRRKTDMSQSDMFRAINRRPEMYGTSFFSDEKAYFQLDQNRVFVRFVSDEPQFGRGAGRLSGTLKPKDSPETAPTTPNANSSDRTPAITGYHKRVLELSFDGEYFYIGDRNDDRVSGVIKQLPSSDGDSLGNPVAPDMWPNDYWREAGYHVGKPSELLVNGQAMQSEIAFLCSLPGANARITRSPAAAKSEIRIEIDINNYVYDFLVDESYGYAVRRREDRTKAGQVLRVTTCSDFKLHSGRVWLPWTISVDEFIWRQSGSPTPPSSTPVFNELYKVTNIDELPVDSKVFAIHYDKPGSIVTDYSLKSGGEPVAYKVPARPEDLDSVIAEARGEESVSILRWLLIGGNLALVAGILLWILLRRRSKASDGI